MRGVKHNLTFKVFWILSYLQLLPSASDGQHGIFSSAANTFPYPLLNQETDAPIMSSIAVMHEIEVRLWVIFVHAMCLRGGTSDLAGLKRVDLLAVLVEAHAGRGSAVTATLAGTDTLWCVSKSLCECAWQREVIALCVVKTYRTILPWIAQETQYWSLRYILGTEYSAKTEASEMSPVWMSCQSAVYYSPPCMSSF
jgi:hypothetical protein